MKKSAFQFILLLLFIFSSDSIFSQHICGVDHLHNINDTTYTKGLRQADVLLSNYKKNKRLERRRDEVYTIPVVVHIMHTGGEIGSVYNPADTVIENLIEGLNLAFSATHPNYYNKEEGGVDIGIQFELAKRTNTCESTTGINHIDLSDRPEYIQYGVNRLENGDGLHDDDLKSIIHWPTYEYMNVYIVKGFTESIGGYANYPSAWSDYPGYVEDGIVMTYSSSYGLNTLVHEVGHWLNLKHTFNGSGDNGTDCPVNDDCELDGDGVCDTEPHKQSTGCDETAINMCTGEAYGEIVNNFMSYSCDKLFTEGQKQRMIDALLVLRPSLLISKGNLPVTNEESMTFAIDYADGYGEPLCKDSYVFYELGTFANIGSNYSFDWFVNDTLQETDSDYYFYSPKLNDVIRCETETDYKCYTSSRLVSNEIVIDELVEKPSFEIVSDKPYPCIGDSLTLTVSNILNAGDDFDFYWSFGDSIVGEELSRRYFVTSEKQNPYIRLNPDNTCSAVINYYYFTGAESFTPYLQIEGIDTTLKCGNSWHGFNTSDNTILGDDYILTWKINGEIKRESELDYSFYTQEVINNDVVSLEVEFLNQCSGLSSLSSEIIVSTYPQLEYVLDSNLVTINNLPDNQFVLVQYLGEGLSSYSFVFDDYTNLLEYGDYRASYYNGTCTQYSDTIYYNLDVISGIIKSNSVDKIIELSPNPSSTYFMLNIDDFESGNIRILNSIGEVVIKDSVESNYYEHNLSNGIYYIQLEISGNKYYKKFTVLNE